MSHITRQYPNSNKLIFKGFNEDSMLTPDSNTTQIPQARLPPNDDDDELPNVGVEVDPKAGAELPKAGEDEAPKAVVEEKGEDC